MTRSPLPPAARRNPPPDLAVIPVLFFRDRQRGKRFDLSFIRALAVQALPFCRDAALPGSPLLQLERVDITILSDARIAAVHGDFFNDPTPTDVITFPDGDILIGAGVVSENARDFGQKADEEAALCAVHGLLHLGGWEDLSARDAKRMAKMQEQIFNKARGML